ncbi:hypothetical protein ACLOJK_023819 [Asimina triloba]
MRAARSERFQGRLATAKAEKPRPTEDDREGRRRSVVAARERKDEGAKAGVEGGRGRAIRLLESMGTVYELCGLRAIRAMNALTVHFENEARKSCG